MLENTKGQSKMDYPEKTGNQHRAHKKQDKDKHTKNTTQYVFGLKQDISPLDLNKTLALWT